MANRFGKLLCALVALGLSPAVTTPTFAGPTPTPEPTFTPGTPVPTPTATPTPTPTVTPTATPTATPAATPTATPTGTPAPQCEDLWPIDSIVTIAKGQSAANNAKVNHHITGNIIDPASVCPTDGACTSHRIPVCAGTGVTIAITGSIQNTNVGKGVISCNATSCSVGAVNVTEKYKSVSADGKDTDRVSLLPK